jgi:hypothetical protein
MAAGYPHTTFKSEQLVRLDPPADSPLAREAVFEFEQQNEPVVSYLWTTGVAKNFVKLRFSASGRLRDELPDARRAILAALGAAVKPHLVPVDAKADKPGVAVVVNSVGSQAEMSAGLGYLVVLSAMIDKSPESVPVCGGEFIPDYANELAAYQAMLQIWGETRGGSDCAGWIHARTVQQVAQEAPQALQSARVRARRCQAPETNAPGAGFIEEWGCK